MSSVTDTALDALDNLANALASCVLTTEPVTAPVVEPMASTVLLTDESRAALRSNFTKCVQGYHLVNNDPIKESPWEDVNTIVLEASGFPVADKANGSHKSGSDLTCALGGFSNKSTQYDGVKQTKDAFKISSYRLTTVCSDKTPGAIADVLAEIQRRKNFAYYSIIVRDESPKEIQYDWFLIPADFPAFNPASYTWTPKVGKTGRNKGAVTGWETNVVDGSSMSISFSMSSQLWMNIHITDAMRAFIVGSCRVEKARKFNYITLLDALLPAPVPAPTETP